MSRIAALIVAASITFPALVMAQPSPHALPGPPSTTPASPTAPAAPTTPASPTQATATPPAASATKAKRTTATSAALATDQYATEGAAKTACAGDPVVWANLSGKVYHMSGTKYYGKTRRGAYMCQKAANGDGYHESKGG
jgi:hypothetical protein